MRDTKSRFHLPAYGGEVLVLHTSGRSTDWGMYLLYTDLELLGRLDETFMNDSHSLHTNNVSV